MTWMRRLPSVSKASDGVGGWVISAALVALSVTWWPGLVAGQLPKWMLLYVLCLGLPFLRVRFDAVMLAGLAFVGWLCLTVLWSEDQRQSLHQLHKLLPLVVCFLAGRVYGEQPVMRAAGFCVAGVILFEFTIGWHGSFGNENFVTEFLVLMVPFLFVRSIAHIALLVAVGVYLLALPSRIEFVALYGALCAFVAMNYRPWLVFLVGVPVMGLFIEPSAWDIVRDSVLARVELWWNTGVMALEHPLIGHGFGSFNYHYPRFGAEHLTLFDRVEVQIGHHAGAAHNDFLQLVSEAGLIGLAFGGVCLWLIFSRAVPSRSFWAVVAGGSMCLIGFPSQMPVTGALLAYCLGSLAPLSSSPTPISVLWSGGATSSTAKPI